MKTRNTTMVTGVFGKPTLARVKVEDNDGNIKTTIRIKNHKKVWYKERMSIWELEELIEDTAAEVEEQYN